MSGTDAHDPLGVALADIRRRIESVQRSHPASADDGGGLRRMLEQADLRECSPEFRQVATRFLNGHSGPADVRRHPDYARILGARLAEKRED
ncbi:hypothetical protein F4692_003056 [Nocardioides cavernae]|uniref:Uncharacterized protein n=1 Tax=Nocardioides cavernae TaxID=1921566 RepID=A0A7Y9H4R9_9ACTN|nr:hypothetical protein [Nocardioides cavernae]NYE37911.1 hypothetical protein [Nocardioides cavernae]